MRRLRVLGHPIHPLSVHLPFGLLVAASGWDAAWWLTGTDAWWAAGTWTLLAGVATGVAAATTGLLDYAALPAEHPAGTLATWHLAAMSAALGCYGLALALRWAGPSPAAVATALAGLVLLLGGGWLGGELVYGHGFGVSEEDS